MGLEENGVWIASDGFRVRGSVLVGADGVNGVTGRLLDLGGPRVYCVAIEGKLPIDQLDNRYRGRVVIELGTVAGGYSWIFPKGDHFNVGVFGWESEGPRLRAYLARLCHAHGSSVRSLREVAGHRLPLRRRSGVLARGRALVVGNGPE